MSDAQKVPLAQPMLHGLMAGLGDYWRQLKPREKRGVTVASVVLFVALLWWLALAPALQTLRQAPEQHRRLDAQIQTLQSMSREAKALQSQPKLSLDDAQKALQSTVTQGFGTAGQVNVNGEKATVTLKNAPPRELAQWLTQARVNARAFPTEVKLVRSTTAPANAATKSTTAATTTTTKTPGNSPATSVNLNSPSPTVSVAVNANPKISWDGTLVLDFPKK